MLPPRGMEVRTKNINNGDATTESKTELTDDNNDRHGHDGDDNSIK